MSLLISCLTKICGQESFENTSFLFHIWFSLNKFTLIKVWICLIFSMWNEATSAGIYNKLPWILIYEFLYYTHSKCNQVWMNSSLNDRQHMLMFAIINARLVNMKADAFWYKVCDICFVWFCWDHMSCQKRAVGHKLNLKCKLLASGSGALWVWLNIFHFTGITRHLWRAGLAQEILTDGINTPSLI